MWCMCSAFLYGLCCVCVCGICLHACCLCCMCGVHVYNVNYLFCMSVFVWYICMLGVMYVWYFGGK